MKCEKCGKEIPNGSKFCVECGTPVKVQTNLQPEMTAAVAPDDTDKKRRSKKKTILLIVIITASVLALGMVVWIGASCVNCAKSFVSDFQNGFEENEGFQFAKAFIESNEEIQAVTGKIESIKVEGANLYSGFDAAGSFKRDTFSVRINDDRLVTIIVLERNGEWSVEDWRIEIAHS